MDRMSAKEYIALQSQLVWKRRLLQGFFGWLCFDVLWRVKITGLENIPTSGGVLMIMNHVSSIDPFLAVGSVRSRYVVPISKVENLEVPVVGWLIRQWGTVTLRRGEPELRVLSNLIEIMKAGEVVMIAPEGTRSPQGLREPKEGFAFLATKADAVVVPMGISAGAIDWKTRMKQFRKADVHVNFGKPFRFNTAQGRPTREVLASMSHEAMYQLALALPSPELRGAYSDLSKLTTDTITFV
jgi:1-acyl-sn-glycerol-3-phosphate acyltransferase